MGSWAAVSGKAYFLLKEWSRIKQEGRGFGAHRGREISHQVSLYGYWARK